MTAKEKVELDVDLKGLEAERQGHIRVIGWAAAILAAIGAAVTIYFQFKEHSWAWGIVADFILLAVWAYVISNQKSKFTGTFKLTVMPQLVHALGEGLAYLPGGHLDEAEFADCGLFKSPDRYSGCDLVEGYVGKTDLRFSLVHAEEEYIEYRTVTETDSDGHSHTRTETSTEYRDIFRGLLFSADCNKQFMGETRIFPGGSNFIDRLNHSHVSLEDPEFMRLFTVYGSDQVEARYLLTPSIMESILSLRTWAGSSLRLSFAHGRIYVAFAMDLNTFVPSIWRRIDNVDSVSSYLGILRAIVSIVDGLNLNTRIWSKRPEQFPEDGDRGSWKEAAEA